MKQRGALIVALLATAAVCVQNAGVGMGIGWGVIHGAGPAALLFLVPLAVGLALLWTGYVLARRMNVRYMPVLFAVYALGILVVNEMVLPATPLNAWRTQRAIDAVEVTALRDEAFLTARGNPAGIRLTFEARFPQPLVGFVSASTFGPVDGKIPYPLQFGRLHQLLIEPTPPARGPYYAFQKDTVYRFTETTLPNFISYDERTQEPCFNIVTTPFREADFLDALARSGNVRYSTAIQIGTDEGPVSVVVQTYTTARAYDLSAMYQTIVQERARQCGP
ncbi:MAG: hypothetical protein M3541_13695 [Acidobacteriota bacterium]|nr:hypothetical protein [Acidobacteriota bacterium]MDQ3419808.1 hypothetical protein [Acidobacteriota bacterium]